MKNIVKVGAVLSLLAVLAACKGELEQACIDSGSFDEAGCKCAQDVADALNKGAEKADLREKAMIRFLTKQGDLPNIMSQLGTMNTMNLETSFKSGARKQCGLFKLQF